MLAECLTKCPDDQWAQPVGTYPFWMVAYHALCYTDVYLAKNNRSWKPDKGTKGGPPALHPTGRKELSEEFPSRQFEREELLRYTGMIRLRIAEALKAETAQTLAGPTGFFWVPGTRAEMYPYNLRHLAHHTGQLTAFLRRCGVKTGWVFGGWK